MHLWGNTREKMAWNARCFHRIVKENSVCSIQTWISWKLYRLLWAILAVSLELASVILNNSKRERCNWCFNPSGMLYLSNFVNKYIHCFLSLNLTENTENLKLPGMGTVLFSGIFCTVIHWFSWITSPWYRGRTLGWALDLCMGDQYNKG